MIVPVKPWPIVIRPYAPSHRQFRLSEDLTPEQITEALKIEPAMRPTTDGKVTMTWTFWAEATFPKPSGKGHLSTSIGCKIWDYCGARWSAYGWPEAFAAVGFTPLMTHDYGNWQFEEDGNDTIDAIAWGLAAKEQAA